MKYIYEWVKKIIFYVWIFKIEFYFWKQLQIIFNNYLKKNVYSRGGFENNTKPIQDLFFSMFFKP